MYQLYGIPNCDTVKKARAYLAERGVVYEFVDFKKTPPTPSELARWKQALGEWPLNKRGPTFRKHQAELEQFSEGKLAAFIITHSSMIKRPILERKGKVLAFGFQLATYQQIFA